MRRQLPQLAGIGVATGQGRARSGAGRVSRGGYRGGFEDSGGAPRAAGVPCLRTFFDILCDCPYEWEGHIRTPAAAPEA